jgi:uncharacterized protein (TIGR03545 family)
MIRWKYVGFRLFVLIAVLMLLRWTAGPVAQWMVVRSLESSTGAKVEIASTEVGLFPPMLHLKGLKVADPKREMRNAIEMEDIYLAVDGGALLKRRYEISNGRLKGIRIGTDRTESGWLEVIEEEPVEDAEGPSLIERISSSLVDDTKSQADAFVDDLKTISESKRIKAYWENEYAVLRTRAKGLEETIRSLKGSIRKVENPLRDLPELQATLERVEGLRRELVDVRQKLDGMPAMVRSDFEALEAAKRADQEKLASYLPADYRDSSLTELGPDLLGKIVRDHLQTVRGYLDSGRSIAEVTVTGPKAQRDRGETILMGPRFPGWLIQRCEIDGFLHANSEEYSMIGVVENVTSDTDNLTGPMHARLRLEGPRVVRVDFERFYDSAIPRDHLKVHWPSLDLPAKQIGSKKVALAVDGGKLELWVDIDAQGDQISGRLVSKQTGTQLGLDTKPGLASNVVVQSLQRKLSEIDHIDVDARFAGTWRKLDLNINTNLTSQLADSMISVVEDTMVAARQNLAGRVDQVYQSQVNELQNWLTTQQTDARQMLASVDSTIDKLRTSVMSELSTPDAYLSRLRTGVGRVLK